VGKYPFFSNEKKPGLRRGSSSLLVKKGKEEGLGGTGEQCNILHRDYVPIPAALKITVSRSSLGFQKKWKGEDDRGISSKPSFGVGSGKKPRRDKDFYNCWKMRGGDKVKGWAVANEGGAQLCFFQTTVREMEN